MIFSQAGRKWRAIIFLNKEIMSRSKHKKWSTDGQISQPVDFGGGDDGTRTRDLWLDRLFQGVKLTTRLYVTILF